jgi:hypothetical protein
VLALKNSRKHRSALHKGMQSNLSLLTLFLRKKNPKYPINRRLGACNLGENFPVPTRNQTQDHPAFTA